VFRQSAPHRFCRLGNPTDGKWSRDQVFSRPIRRNRRKVAIPAAHSGTTAVLPHHGGARGDTESIGGKVIDEATHQEVFGWVLKQLARGGLIKDHRDRLDNSGRQCPHEVHRSAQHAGELHRMSKTVGGS